MCGNIGTENKKKEERKLLFPDHCGRHKGGVRNDRTPSFVSHFHPSLDRLKQRHIIGILQIAADGNAFGKPRDLYALRL